MVVDDKPKNLNSDPTRGTTSERDQKDLNKFLNERGLGEAKRPKIRGDISPRSPFDTSAGEDEDQDEDMSSEPFGEDLDRRETRTAQKDYNMPEYTEETPRKTLRTPAEEAGRLPDKAPELQKTTKEAPPGGIAQTPQKPGEVIPKSPGTALKQGGQRPLTQAVKQIANQAIQAVKKAAAQAAQKLKASIAANPYPWLIGLGIVLAILIIIGILSLLGRLGQSPNPVTGKSAHEQVDPVQNMDLLEKFLKLSGETLLTEQKLDQQLDQIKLDLAKIREDSKKKNPQTGDLIANETIAVDGTINTLKNSKTKANAIAFITELQKLYNMLEDSAPAYAADKITRIPVATAPTSFNKDLHGNSKQHPELVENNNVYLVSDSGKCDAVDIGATLNSPVRPLFSGKVINVSSDGKPDSTKVMIQDGEYKALYAHLMPPEGSIKEGQNVTTETIIGTVKEDHIQIEILVRNKCIATTSSDLLDSKLANPKHDKIGGYLWDHIVEKFHLSSQ